MQRYFLLACLLVTGALFTSAADETPTASDLAEPAPTELEVLADRIIAKISAGQKTPAALATELAAYDELFAKYKEKDREEAARVLFMKAMLYDSVFKDAAFAHKLFEKIKTEFPRTQAAAMADAQIAAAQTLTRLIGKPAPELHFLWTSHTEHERIKKLSDLKGKVIVLDFWHTGCGPCVASFPQIRELASHYEGCDVEIIGVTSIQGAVYGLTPYRIDTPGDPKKEMSLMADYIKAKNITWTIAFSKENVFNADYGVISVPSMVFIAPDGTVRHVDIHPADPEAKKQEKIDALLEEFRLKLPAAPRKS